MNYILDLLVVYVLGNNVKVFFSLVFFLSRQLYDGFAIVRNIRIHHRSFRCAFYCRPLHGVTKIASEAPVVNAFRAK